MADIYEHIKDNLYDIAEAANISFPNVKIVFSYDGGPEPSTSFISIYPLRIKQVGRRSTPALSSSNNMLDNRAYYEVTTQFSFFGRGAGNVAQAFHDKIGNTVLTKQVAARVNMGYMNKTDVRRNPQKRDTQWVDAYNLDVTFSYILNTKEQVDTDFSGISFQSITNP